MACGSSSLIAELIGANPDVLVSDYYLAPRSLQGSSHSGLLAVALTSSAMIGVMIFISGVIVVAIRAPHAAPEDDDEHGHLR